MHKMLCFPPKPNHCNQMTSVWKQTNTKTPIFTWKTAKFCWIPYINATTSICQTFPDSEMPWFLHLNPNLEILIIFWYHWEKQLARSKIDSKILNYLALFVRVFHPSLFACKPSYFACKMHCIPSILIDPECSMGFSTNEKYQNHMFW